MNFLIRVMAVAVVTLIAIGVLHVNYALGGHDQSGLLCVAAVALLGAFALDELI